MQHSHVGHTYANVIRWLLSFILAVTCNLLALMNLTVIMIAGVLVDSKIISMLMRGLTTSKI